MPADRRFQRLHAHEILDFLQRHPAVTLLDARDAQRFEDGHLAGAALLDGRNHERILLSAPKDRPVLIYCYHGNSSQTYAQMFADFGFKSVYDLVGGYEAWERFLAERPCGPKDTAPVAAGLDPDLATWLQANGFASINGKGSHGNTPLMHAAWRGELSIVEALLDHGADVKATNGDGNNALWLACVHGDPALLRRLVAAGTPIDHLNDNGASCLMYAASASKPEVLATLLELGADPKLKSLDDFTALDMAASVECLQILRRAVPRQTA